MISGLPARYFKTRLAPTPSGYLHIGNALSFAVTASLAIRSGASMLLRIDDLDAARVRPEYITDIFTMLRLLDIEWQEGPENAAEHARIFSQGFRLPLYNDALERLHSTGNVYACTCSRARSESLAGYAGTCRNKDLPLNTAGACWRLRTNAEESILLKSFFGTMAEHLLPAVMTDFVVKKKDGYPAYQLTSVVDDVHFGVDLIVRGDDLRNSSLAQLILARRLGFNHYLATAHFFHPIIFNADARKMSKSQGAHSIAEMVHSGLRQHDLLNLIGESIGIKGLESWEPLAEILLSRVQG